MHSVLYQAKQHGLADLFRWK